MTRSDDGQATGAILATVRSFGLSHPMKCPKCSASFDTAPDAAGIVLCPGCGAKLRSRPAAQPADAATLDTILAEVRAVRHTQDEILALLRAHPRADAEHPPVPLHVDEPVVTPRAIRKGTQKTVLLIDDQDESRQEAVAALEQARVPTRGLATGPKGLESLAAERCDVIVLELAIGGAMAGRDVINMIKATMEWIDIPIVLYTRLPITTQKEARTVHGADEVVLKGPGSAEALVAQVIQLFRHG
jgi:CheY-like chemotaxis protein